MKNNMKNYLLLAVGLILLGAGLIGTGRMIAGSKSQSVSWNIGDFITFGNNQGKNVFTSADISEGTIEIKSFNKLIVDNAAIDFVLEQGDELKLEYYTVKGKEPIVSNKGDTLTISEPSRSMKGLWKTTRTICYRLIVPKGTVIEADIGTSSGSIDVSSVELSGKVHASAGRIIMSEIEGEDLKIYSTSGSISLTDIRNESVDVASTSGGMTIAEVEAATLKTKITSGGVTADSCKIKTFEHSGSSGSVVIKGMTADAAEIGSTSGSVKITDSSFDSIKVKSSSGSIKMKLDEVNKITSESTSGSVKLSLPGDESDYDYNLRCTSGSIKVNGESYSKKYKANYGGKKLDVETTSGSIHIDF